MKQDNRFQIVVRPEEFPAILSKNPLPQDEDEKSSITATQAFLGHVVGLKVQVIHRRTAPLIQPAPIVLTNGVNPDNAVQFD